MSKFYVVPTRNRDTFFALTKMSLFWGEENSAKKNTLIYLNIEQKCRTGYYFLFLNLKIRKKIFQFSTRNQPQILETLKNQIRKLFSKIFSTTLKAEFESELHEELERVYRRANLTYEIIKLVGESLQSAQKYSHIEDVIGLKFSKNYISRFMSRYGLRKN